MFTSAELIEALRRRTRSSLRPDPGAGEFPPGWSAWFAAMGERLGAIRGATAAALVGVMMQREPLPPPAAAIELNRWRAFNTLWRQQWQPASADERWVRMVAWLVTVFTHVLLALLLLWLAYVRFTGEAPAEAVGDDAVQVEFIGDGTPEDGAGGAPPTEGPTTPAVAAAAGAVGERSPAPATAAEPAAAASTAAPPVVVEVAPVATAPAPTPQPLQVTEVAVPDTSFVLPPVAVAPVRPPELPTPETGQAVLQTRAVDIPMPAPVVRRPAPTQPAAPSLRQETVELSRRDVPSPIAPTPRPSVTAPVVVTPDLRRDAPAVSRRDVPTPAAPPTATAPAGAATRPDSGRAATAAAPQANAQAGAAPVPGGTLAAAGGAPSVASRPGDGAASGPRPGALPSPRRGDDWGDSTRNVPGGQAGRGPGLFNADGSPRLAPGANAAPGGGLPPGTVEERIANIDRAGSWLRRKPNDYEPTTFDQYWVPNETLLAEWVRRSIKEVLIPIPGTSKKIKCAVALLALGGGCGITDSDMVDIEASARPPPDVPFKRELQEDQGSLRQSTP